MSKMTCAEAIFDELAGKFSTAIDHECFDDIFMACFALATDSAADPDVPKWIASKDVERSEEDVLLDICAYFRKYNNTARPSEIISRAIAAGKKAL